VSPALLVLAAFLLISLGLGLLAQRGKSVNLEQWAVGGRGFGTLFVFLLTAGEVYTTFTFLGGSGWAYGRGAPAFYILCYGAIAYALSYFILPPIWRYATERRLHSQADFFAAKYDSRFLGVLVAVVSVAALMPYLVLQLKGLGIIVSEMSYGAVPQVAAVWIGVAVLVVYVTVSGVHGSAWTSVLKDVMILVVVVALGVILPARYYGGWQPMFEAIEKARPGFLTLPAKGLSVSWFTSTVLLSAVGFYMWPHAFAATYTAKSARVLRRNAAMMPLYQLVLLFVFFTGFAAVLQVPGLAGADADLSLLRLSKMSFSPWVVGLIGAAGLLTALVPGSMILLTASTILTKNVYRLFAPGDDDRRLGIVARLGVPLFAIAAAVITLHGGAAIVPLLLMGYSLVTQLAPALLLSLGRRPLATRTGAIAGLVVGEALVLWLTFGGVTLAKLLPSWPAAVTDLNVGVVALAANAAVLAAVSLATAPRRTA
jgi:solute:Na+ symporter, SSS family